jgi:hypothetical protein
MLRGSVAYQFLAYQPIVAMFAGGLDLDDIGSRLDEISLIIFAIPFEGIFSGGTGRAGHCTEGSFIRLVQSPVFEIPGFKLRKIPVASVPDRYGPDSSVVLIFHPYGDIGPFGEAFFLQVDFEVDD